MVQLDSLPRLMLVTDRHRARGRDLVSIVAEAVRGGVGIVQFREPDLDDDGLRRLIEGVRVATPRETRFLVNARAELAAELELGLHLPAAHPPLAPTDPARRRLHGRSAHDEPEAKRAADEGASYLVLGTIYPTPSKPGHPGSGPQLLRRVAPRVAPLPVYAIGGVLVSRIPRLLHAGAYGVAVCGAILTANDPRRVAQAMALALEVTVHAIER